MTGITQVLMGSAAMALTGEAEPGSLDFTEAGTHDFLVPSGVTSISILAVGGGGSGATRISASMEGGGGGQGGCLAYSNSIPVTPGETLTVTVGGGGASRIEGNLNGEDGGDSSVARGGTTLVLAKGGQGGISGNGFFADGATAAQCVGNVKYAGGRGGAGGTSEAGGGGGAAGYAGNGGDGTDSDAGPGLANDGSGGGGASGGSGDSDVKNGAGGGGVGVEGQGASGLAIPGVWTYGAYGGGGGSGGADGGNSTVNGEAGAGGLYGGGGGGLNDDEAGGVSGAGGGGAVQIIWGATYVWPTPPTPLPPPPLVETLGLHEIASFTGGAGGDWNEHEIDIRAFAGCDVRIVFSWEVNTTGPVYYEDVCLDRVQIRDDTGATLVSNSFSVPNAAWSTSQAALGQTYSGVPTWYGLQDPNTDGYWCEIGTQTPSAGTGAVTPVYGTDFLYTETSSPVQNGDVFWLRRAAITLAGNADKLILNEARDTFSPNSVLQVYFDVEALAP